MGATNQHNDVRGETAVAIMHLKSIREHLFITTYQIKRIINIILLFYVKSYTYIFYLFKSFLIYL